MLITLKKPNLCIEHHMMVCDNIDVITMENNFAQ